MLLQIFSVWLKQYSYIIWCLKGYIANDQKDVMNVLADESSTVGVV